MSVRTDIINLQVNINGNKAQADLNNLRKKAGDIKDAMAGLKKGTDDYIAKAKELSTVNAEMDKLKKTIGITALSQKELNQELAKLRALKGSVVPFTKEYEALDKSIKQVEKRLYDVKNGVQGFASFFSKIKDEVKQFGLVAAGYLGFQFITSQFQNIINGAGKMSDQLADLRRVTGLTAEETTRLNNALSAIDTRTSTSGLREIAIIAGKLGVEGVDNLTSFAEATDKLVVALGDELGNADQITTSLGKILNVFDGGVNGDNITKLGNAIVQLANDGVASGGFIVDFTTRLAGLSNVAGITLDASIGLAAGLEELGLRSESSTTAVIKILGDIASDVPKFAKVAGKSIEEFSNTLATKPIEALIQVSEGFSKNKNGFAEISASFKEAGADGARVISTLGTIGGKADFLRGKIVDAGEALKNTNAITDAFNLKNETFGATLDKLGKEFNKLILSSGVTNFFKSIVDGALNFITVLRKLPQFIEENNVALITLAAGIALMNKQLIISALVTIRDSVAKAYNITITRLLASTTGIATAAQAAYITVTTLLTGRITLATAAQRLWNIAISFSAAAIGGFIAVAAGLVLVISALGTKTKELTDAQKAQLDVQAKLSELTAEEEGHVKSLYNEITKSNVGYSEKKKLLAELIAINPEYLSGLTLENIKTAEGTKILDTYISKLREANQAKARAAVIDDKEKRRQDLENKINDAYTVTKDDQGNVVSKELRNKDNSLIGAVKSLWNDNEVAALQKDQQELETINSQLDALYGEMGTTVQKTLEEQKQGAAALAASTVRSIETIKAQIKTLDDAYEKINVTDKKALSSNRAGRKKLQDELDALEGKKAPGAAKSENTYANLKKEAEAFYKDIQNLKKRTAAGDDPGAQEIEATKQKYEALLAKATNYFAKNAIDKKRFNEEEKILEEAQRKEINDIFQKFYKQRLEEQGNKEYEESLLARQEYADDLKTAAAKEYADGKLSKKQYSAELKQIDKDEAADRIIIAQDYSETVKKASTDVYKFRKQNEKLTTQDAIEQAELRKKTANEEALAAKRRVVLTTRKGTTENRDAQQDLLIEKYRQELEAYDEFSEQYKEKYEELQQGLADIDKEYIQQKIDQYSQYADYALQALTSLNTILNNRENAAFAKEKALADKKKKLFKDQLDNKLISQAQYDKKVSILQEQQDARERELKRKQAKREKALNIFRAVVNVAAGVASSLAYGGPVGIALAVATGILGALEIAAIASAPLPELGKGDWVRDGDKHSDPSGGQVVKIERDEAVISAAAMTDPNTYTISGTPAQITSRLNSQAGGVSWAGGAIVQKAGWMRKPPSTIAADAPFIMQQGGSSYRAQQQDAGNEQIIDLLNKNLVVNTAVLEATKAYPTTVTGKWVIKDLDETRDNYNAARTASSVKQ